MADVPMPKQRVKSLDVFKGFAIVGIVFAHLVLLQPVLEGAVNQSSVVKTTVLEYLYVGIIIFFAISGYFYNPEEGLSKKVLGRLLKLVIAFVLCMVVLTSVIYVYLTVLGYNIAFDDYVATMVNGLLGGGGAFQPYVNVTANDISECGIYAGYYFVEVLVLATLLYYLIARYALKDNVCSAVIIIALLTASMFCVEVIGVKLPYYLELVPIATAAMLMGTIAHRYGIVEKMERDTFDRRLVIAVLICFVLGVLLCLSPLRSDLGFHRSHLGLFGGFSAYTIFLISMICGFTHIYIATLVSKIPYVCQFLMFFGKYSLGILMLNTFFCKVLIAPFITLEPYFTYPCLEPIQMVVVGSASVVLSVFTTYVIREIIQRMSERKQSAAAQ